MEIENLVRMANRIGDFFEAMPDRGEALEGIAGHLQRFWEPRLRRELLAHIDAHGGAGLSPIVLQAIGLYRERLHGKAPA